MKGILKIFLSFLFLVFFLCGIAQAIPLNFNSVAGTGSLLFDVSAKDEISDISLHTMEFGIQTDETSGSIVHEYTLAPINNFLAIPVKLNDFSWAPEEYKYFSGIIDYALSVDNGFVEVGRVDNSDSFTLSVYVIQPDIGTSTYSFYFDTQQPFDFNNVYAGLSLASPNQVIIDFAVVNTGNETISSAAITATVSGDFAPVPEPATILLLSTGLVGIAGLRRKFKK